MINFAKFMTGQISKECGEWIVRIEEMIEMSLNDLFFECMDVIETAMCDGKVERPICTTLDSCFDA